MKKFKFRMQVVLDLREKELEERQMEMAKILTALKTQEEKLQSILQHQEENTQKQECLAIAEDIDVFQLEEHRTYGLKLIVDARNQERVIDNTRSILETKQKEVREAHQKVEILKKLKEKQEKQFYKDFLQVEMKEMDDITTARYKIG